MSAIVAAMVAWQRVADRAAAPGFRAFVSDRIERAGRVIAAASNAAGAGRVVEEMTDPAIEWTRPGEMWWAWSGSMVVAIIKPPRRRLRPAWLGGAWVWSTAAHDPRPCAWPRPFARGADR